MPFHAPPDDWRACYARLNPRLLLFARQFLPGWADAEDVVQVAFLRVWQKNGARAADQPGLFFAAVRTIALNHLRQQTRCQQREQTALAEETLPTFDRAGGSFFEELSEPYAEAADRPRRLAQAIGGLPAEQREVLVLKVWGELTFADIATTLSIPANTTASRYRYALAGLKKVLHTACHE